MKYRVNFWRTIMQEAETTVEVSLDEYPDEADHIDVARELACEKLKWRDRKTLDNDSEVKKL